MAEDSAKTPAQKGKPAVVQIAQGKPKAPKKTPPPAKADVPPPVAPARVKSRHWLTLLIFVLMVIGPIAAATWYMYTQAADQYASRVGFSVRSEDAITPGELLGGIAALSTGTSKDSDVLYEFIQSQQLVAEIDTRIDLKALYAKPTEDILFRFDPADPIEDLRRYWGRMVRINYDAGTGLIELRVNAFAPEDAQRIAEEIFTISSRLINDLSAIARTDATAYAKAELTRSEDRLKDARQKMTVFRNTNQIADPSADIQGQMGLLSSLQAQLTDSLIALDLLRETTRANDPRIAQEERRIAIIEQRIAEERAKFGLSGQDSGAEFAALLGEYEALIVDREFAEQSYLAARASYDAALADAQRQSRYLAAYIEPTLAETAEYPKRELLIALIGVFAFLIWAVLVLSAYSLRDRR